MVSWHEQKGFGDYLSLTFNQQEYFNRDLLKKCTGGTFTIVRKKRIKIGKFKTTVYKLNISQKECLQLSDILKAAAREGSDIKTW